MRRLAAVVGAVAMIGLALFVRGLIDDDGGGGGGGGGNGGGDDESTLVVCADGLDEACEALARRDGVDTRVEEPLTTLGALDDGSFDGDAWLAPAPWIAIARDRPDPVIGEPSPVIARARVAVFVDRDARQPLTTACKGTITWRCLGELAETSVRGIPGRVEVGFADPESGPGLAVLGAAASGFFRSPDFAANDFTEPAFDTWLGGLAANAADVASGRSVLDRLVTERGRFTVVALATADTTAGSGDRVVDAVYPAPVATSDLVLAPVRGRLSDDDVRRLASDGDLRAGLDDWLPPNDPDLPKTSSQPRGGVLAALLQRWQEAAR